jgi:hypothetical protein
MSVLIKKFGGLALIAGFLLLAACGGQGSASPTPDAALIYTSAAQTVQAELTEVINQRSPTPTITPFPEMTNTPEVPTAVFTDGTVVPTLPGPQSVDTTLTVMPTSAVPAATLSVGKAADKAQWISNTPPDNATVETGAKFDATFVMKNTGTTTWKTSYTYRYFAGSLPVERRSYNFPTDVKPGDTGTFIIDVVAPQKAGPYNIWFKLTNDLGQNFGDMTLNVIVVNPDETSTATPEPTTPITPTATPE